MFWGITPAAGAVTLNRVLKALGVLVVARDTRFHPVVRSLSAGEVTVAAADKAVVKADLELTQKPSLALIAVSAS